MASTHHHTTSLIACLGIVIALLFSVQIECDAQNATESELGYWPGLEAHYGRGIYNIPGAAPIKLPQVEQDQWWTRWNVGWAAGKLGCTFDQIAKHNVWSVWPDHWQNGNLLCSLEGKRLTTGALKQHEYSESLTWMLVRADQSEIESFSIKMSPETDLHRIIYEQKKGTQLKKVQPKFIAFWKRKSYKDHTELAKKTNSTHEPRGDLRLTFMGNIAPNAFSKGAFDEYLSQTNRPLYLEFDLANAKEALQIVDQDTFEPVIRRRSFHDKFTGTFKEEVSMTPWMPRRTGDWSGPSLTSPQWNRFTVDCSNEKNSWLKFYALSSIPKPERGPHRYLYFNCEDGTEVNLYTKWYPNNKLPYPVDESLDPNPSPNPSRSTITPTPSRPMDRTTVAPVESESGSNWWIYALVALIVVIILVSVAVYFLVFNQAHAAGVSGAPSGMGAMSCRSLVPSGGTSRASAVGPSSIGPQQTARSGISNSMAQRRASGPSRFSRASSAAGAGASKARSASRMSSRPSGSRAVASRSRAPSSRPASSKV